MPLDEYTDKIPPGWKPGMESYPLRLYVDKLTLWWKQADVDLTHASVLIVGRLKTGAGKVAMKLRLERKQSDHPPDYDVGADAIVRARVPEEKDDLTGAVTQPMIPSGMERLIANLVERYGLDDQDTVTVALDHFFDYRRGDLSLQEYVNEFVIRYDDAEAKGGLQMNSVGLAHLMLKFSGISDKAKDYLKLRVDGNLEKYETLRTLMLRMARAPEKEKYAYPVHDNYWYGSSYDEDSFYYQDYDYDYDYDDTSYHYGEGDPEGEDYDYDYDADVQGHSSEAYWKGKGKGKSKGKSFGKGNKGKASGGCSRCGSKWHSSDDCPVAKVEESGKGKSDAHYEQDDSYYEEQEGQYWGKASDVKVKEKASGETKAKASSGDHMAKAKEKVSGVKAKAKALVAEDKNGAMASSRKRRKSQEKLLTLQMKTLMLVRTCMTTTRLVKTTMTLTSPVLSHSNQKSQRRSQWRRPRR